MQFTLLAAAVLALAQVQVQARPLSRSVTYMTYATDLYVDPWVVMQGQRAASTASETAPGVATKALPSPASDATGTATTVSSSATDTATALSSSATGTATNLSSSATGTATTLLSSLTAESASSTESASESEPPAPATEEEQYYSIQTQNAE